MARRSPMNKRYQKDTQVGSTRKSAAAAKPKRSASGGSLSKSSSPKKPSSARSSASSSRVVLPPEIKKLQTIVFAMLGGAVVLSVIYLWLFKQGGLVGSIILGVAYALMFAGLYLDFTKVRPVVRAMQQGKSVPPSKVSKAAKPTKSTENAKTASAADSAGQDDAGATEQTDERTEEGA